jgi:hypothetical protein
MLLADRESNFVTISWNAGEVMMNTDYVLLCGVMWTQHASKDACEELFRALCSDDPDVVLLASALIDQRSASA